MTGGAESYTSSCLGKEKGKFRTSETRQRCCSSHFTSEDIAVWWCSHCFPPVLKVLMESGMYMPFTCGQSWRLISSSLSDASNFIPLPHSCAANEKEDPGVLAQIKRQLAFVCSLRLTGCSKNNSYSFSFCWKLDPACLPLTATNGLG